MNRLMRTMSRCVCVGLAIGSTTVWADTSSENADAVWVYFADKGYATESAQQAAIAQLADTYDQRAIERRLNRRTLPGLFDFDDLPVSPRYINSIKENGVSVRTTSRWLNAISIEANPEQIEQISSLPFVKDIDPVRHGRRVNTPVDQIGDDLFDPTDDDWYGYAKEQTQQLNLIKLHNEGFNGSGVVIGILDTGFKRTHNAFNNAEHPLEVIAEWDFINNDGNTGPEGGDPEDQYVHGTLILGTLGSYEPNELVGAAYGASYILCKTEDISNEYPAEEDYYVAGLEYIESLGGDVATSSLGYIDWYTQNDLDGETAVTTIAVNAATANGVFCCTAAGNEGNDGNPNSSHLIAPADAFQVLTCGSVNAYGEVSGFSSDGPTADGRVKPEVLARGEETRTVWPWDNYNYAEASGTSLSTPLIAGVTACLVGAEPRWTVDEMRSYLFDTASYYRDHGEPDPLYVQGYGIVDAYAALDWLDFIEVVPGEAGVVNSLIAANATPETPVVFIWGLSTGSANVPGCEGLSVRIASPRIAGWATAYANGDAVLDVSVPGSASGMEVFFQVIEHVNCRPSDLYVMTFL